MLKVCAICSKEFDGYRSSKLCSPECRVEKERQRSALRLSTSEGQEYQTTYRKEHRKQLNLNAADYRKNTKEQRSSSNKSRYLLNPEKFKISVRKTKLKSLGWTIELYDKFFEKQEGLCAICKRKVEDRRMDCDHEHTEPPKPRGLLCGNCNKMLGLVRDSVDILKSAILYLLEHGRNK